MNSLLQKGLNRRARRWNLLQKGLNRRARRWNLLQKGLNRRATTLGRPYNSGSRRGNPMWLPVFFNKLSDFCNSLK